ncbi:hypothetical protein K1X84_11075 [bacterium]|nr:hypothetical protein [bacterium]
MDLSHEEYVISFEFSSLDYSTPSVNQYAYKLEGFDEEWIFSDSRHRIATYTNLEPGDYTLYVKGSNSDGIWNEAGTSMMIRVHPAFWQTLWFKGLMFTIIIGTVWLMYRSRIQRFLEIERLRAKIASDLHDDVGSTLTNISVYSGLLRTGIPMADKVNVLSQIEGLTREVVQAMSDVVWSIDARNDHFESLVNRMSEFAHRMLGPLDIEFKMNIQGDRQMPSAPQIRQVIYLIFKEAITNIVKHSGATKVETQLQWKKDSFIMQIKDNGVGIKISKESTGHGTRNMKARAESIGAILSIDHLNGTVIELQLPSLQYGKKKLIDTDQFFRYFNQYLAKKQ